METEVIKITADNFGEAVRKAADLLLDGEVIALPTETVYGLAANVYDEEAVKLIYEIKGRPQDNPVIVHISNFVMLKDVASEIPESASKLAKRFWPGPLTIVLNKTESISDTVTCGLDTVGVRMPSHPTAREVIEKAGVPLAIPSANLSGKPSTTTAQHVVDDLNGRIPLILDAGPCEIGVESTVITLVGEKPTILRPGIISLAEIREVLPDAVMSSNVLRAVGADERVESPGVKYKHYSPRAEVILVRGSLDKFIKYVKIKNGDGIYAMCFDGEQERIPIASVSYGASNDPKSQAKRVFSVLRALDKIKAITVYVRAPKDDDKSLMVNNRLIRAAGFKVVEL